jgi:membrane protein implicated in regulation of membrane protease activity
MAILALIESYGGWSWVVLGIAILAIELVAPGGVFVWLGAAAIITGIAALVQPITLPFQFALFGILALASIAAWLAMVRRRTPSEESDRPLLNKRAQTLVGRNAILIDAIENGYGRVKLGDTTWRVSGPALDSGTLVKVTGYEGTVLSVEAADKAS